MEVDKRNMNLISVFCIFWRSQVLNIACVSFPLVLSQSWFKYTPCFTWFLYAQISVTVIQLGYTRSPTLQFKFQLLWYINYKQLHKVQILLLTIYSRNHYITMDVFMSSDKSYCFLYHLSVFCHCAFVIHVANRQQSMQMCCLLVSNNKPM